MQDFIQSVLEVLDINPLEVYEMTPREISIKAKLVANTHKEQLKQDIAVAYFREKFARTKKLPKLDKILKELDDQTKKAESKGDMLLRAMAQEKGVDI